MMGIRNITKEWPHAQFVAKNLPSNAKKITNVYFEDTIAKAILFKAADLLYGTKRTGNNIGELKSVVVPYTIGLLNHLTSGRIDLYKIWKNQKISDAPTIGLILCADTDDDVAHYSVLNGSDQLFAAKYLTYMPKREDLRREIEQQKEFYRLQHKEDDRRIKHEKDRSSSSHHT